MSGHTPGPWVARMVDSQEWHIDSRHYAQTGIGTWNGLAVAYGCDDIPNEGAQVAEANARLIAAAPELLECLRWYVENDEVGQMEGNEFWLEGKARAEAAIGKATGETP